MLSSLLYWKELNSFIFVHSSVKKGIPLHRQNKRDLTGLNPPTFDAIPNKVVVFGHTPTFRLGIAGNQVWLQKGMMGIDTGAGHGYTLSLVDLSAWEVYGVNTFGKPNFTHYSLEAHIVKAHVLDQSI